MLSFLNNAALGLGWLFLIMLALAMGAFVIGLIGYWLHPDSGLASPEDLDDPDFCDEREPWPEFREPDSDAVMTGPPGPDTYSDLPPAWISPESVAEPVRIEGDPAMEALGAQSAAWLPPQRINGSPVLAVGKPKPGQPCAD